MTRWLVDASNVIGSRPDGWWRDKPGATKRLLEALERFAGDTGDEVVVVLDADPTGLAGLHGTLEAVVAPRRGRDAAADEIVARLERDSDPASVRCVTTDAGLEG